MMHLSDEQLMLIDKTVKAAVAEAKAEFTKCVSDALAAHVVQCPQIEKIIEQRNTLYGQNGRPGLVTRVDRIEQMRGIFAGLWKPFMAGLLSSAGTTFALWFSGALRFTR